jgi:predicted nucleic acid-binding protein
LNLFAEKNKRKYIFDTSTLIILVEKCGLTDAFSKFAEKRDLYVPLRVIDEFFAGKNAKQYNSVLKDCFIRVDGALAEELLPYFNFDSTSGEIWVISYALRNSSYCCVIDEEFGRSICKLFSINVTGAIGIIEEMKREGILSSNDLHQIRDKIRRTHFYLSKNLCDQLDRICLS